MAAKGPILSALTMVSMAFSLVVASAEIPISVISAAPALLPFEPPLSSPPAPTPTPTPTPALSPDITPLFPSPAGPYPAQSTLPIIPSSPSPPNPDDMIAPGPIIAIPPSGSGLMPDSSSFSLNAFGSLSSVVLLLGSVPLFG